MSDDKMPIKIVLSAVDEVTYKVMEINEKLKKFTAPVKKVQSAFATLGEEAGLGKLTQGLSEVGKGTKDVLDKLGEFGLKAAAVFAITNGVVFELFHSFAEGGESISRASKELGVTTDAYQELAYAAKRSGLDQESFNSSMIKFTKNIAEAAVGAGEAFPIFQAFHIAVRDGHGRLKTMEQILPQVANKLAGLHNQNLKNMVSMRLFGKQGAQLNEFFKDGAKGIDAFREEARKLGGIMTPDQLKEADEVNTRFKNMQFVLGGIRNTIATALGPAFEKLMDKLQGWLTTNKKKIQEWADQFAENLPGYIDSLCGAFDHLAAAVKPVVSVISGLCDVFGGANVAMAALFTYLGGFGLVGSILKLAWSFGKVLGPAMRIAWTVGGLLLDVLGVIAAFVGLPIWAVGALAAAFVAAAVLIWKYWEPIKEFFEKWWGKLGSLFGDSSANLNINQQAQQGPALGPPIGMLGTAQQANASVMPPKQETELKVMFENLPRGTRVETKKADTPVDLTMGYAYPAVGH